MAIAIVARRVDKPGTKKLSCKRTMKMTTNQTPLPDAWETKQKILVILAHPDDPEFFCGATLARWAAAGHVINYCLLTCGDKGAPDDLTHPAELCSARVEEQRAAASVIGAKMVRFLGYPD